MGSFKKCFTKLFFFWGIEPYLCKKEIRLINIGRKHRSTKQVIKMKGKYFCFWCGFDALEMKNCKNFFFYQENVFLKKQIITNMALRNLIENQTIRIDDHKRGSGEVKNWDDQSADIHIDKETHFPIDGKPQKVRIRIPINSDRVLRIEQKNKTLGKIPTKLKKEIQEAFQNISRRDDFIKDMVEVIKNFHTVLESKEQVKQTLERISKHFDLKWYGNELDDLVEYIDRELISYTRNYFDNGKQYSIKVDKTHIEIGEVRKKKLKNRN